MAYDLHITVDPKTLDTSLLGKEWKALDIYNVQGIPHFIISKKHEADYPEHELNAMVDKLKSGGARVRRRKIELVFSDLAAAREAMRKTTVGIVEIHYKYEKRGAFAVSAEQRRELDEKKIALSFNRSSGRVIVSARFENLQAYERAMTSDPLPPYLEDVEREVVVLDSNNALDSFWPLRTLQDPPLTFEMFPEWILQHPR